ncbi:MAG: formate dehydrogenase subunit delta [Caulobacteraceae bacterium]|nr:formate dehydrogenase subunit delta [Caulobacteraceae bacterium]
MDAARLVHMANQIGKFFHAQGEAAAAAGVEDHLRRFWDPRMRREIAAYLEAGGQGLDPAPRAAVARLGRPEDAHS